MTKVEETTVEEILNALEKHVHKADALKPETVLAMAQELIKIRATKALKVNSAAQGVR